MKDDKDFIIESGVLVKYQGKDEHVIVSQGVTTIGDNSFQYCESLKSITIPNSVRLGKTLLILEQEILEFITVTER